MHGESILVDIGVAIIAATVLAYLARLLRQPLLLAYIGAGLLIGPPVLGIVHNSHVISELSELGLAFLMFIVGLEIDLKKLVRSGRTGVMVGVLQVLLCAAMALGAMSLLGFSGLPVLYLGMASAFSSTMIVVKLLSDKSELDTVDGRLTLGILLVQDVLAIVVLALQPNLESPSIAPIALSVLGGLALVGGALVAARFVLPPLFGWAAKSPELILISAVSWCLLVGYLAVAVHFSIAMGALVAGVTLSAFPYTLDVVAKICSLRDFFVTLFFVALGMQLEIGSTEVLVAAVVLSAVVVASRFITVAPLLDALGYGPRVGILTSLALAQAGEFGLVIVSIGLTLGHIGSQVVSIMALTLVATSTLTTYTVISNHAIAQRVMALLARLGLGKSGQPEPLPGPAGGRPEILLVGFHRAASALLHATGYQLNGRPFVVVDFSPEVYQKLRRMNVPILYGDISHLDMLAHAGAADARVVVSTVSDDFLRGTSNAALLSKIKRLNPSARVILTAETLEQARQMYDAGADYVVLPRVETARAFLEALEAIERGTVDDLRAQAIADLADRDEVLA